MDKKIELKVINIANSQAQASAFAMVLQEVDGERQLPVIIGSVEAQAIVLQMKDIKAPRPLTHDLFATTLLSFNISLSEVLIYKAQDGVFFSYVYFKKDETVIRIDARTSDAIALAVRFYCPIYIYESILDRERMIIGEEEGKILERATNEEMVKNSIKEENIETLKKALNRAIQEENYELASVIRDEISRRK